VEVVIHLPDDIAQRIQEKHHDLARHLLECLALEAYRSRVLSEEEVRQLLRFESRFDVHAFLTTHEVPLNYTRKDREKDRDTLNRLGL